MGANDVLEGVAARLRSYGTISALLAAEPVSGQRAYLAAFGEDEAREWLVVDGEARPVETRETVREVASIVLLCELAEELAGGGDLVDLRARLEQLRLTEQVAGIERAEAAALALERAIAPPPRVASPVYLDAVGAATRELERSLGEVDSPFAAALASAAGAVEAFVREVETRYKLPLR